MRYAMLSFLLMGLAVGCAEPYHSTINAEGEQGVFHHASEHQVATSEYHVDPPDEITVKAPNIKELDGQHQVVRPDGKISLNLLGEVYVAGMTPPQINQLLTKLTERYYSNSPDVKVEILAKSKFFYVFGFGAAHMGKIAYTGRDTIVSALAEAGFDRTAWPQQVELSRPGRNGQENATAVVDFKKIWETGDLSQNYLVEEGDIINVRMSPLAAWNEKMTRILGPITGTAGVVTAGTTMAQPTGGTAR
jgi:protein involved in polysaccharide export with SLBB domain